MDPGPAWCILCSDRRHSRQHGAGMFCARCKMWRLWPTFLHPEAGELVLVLQTLVVPLLPQRNLETVLLQKIFVNTVKIFPFAVSRRSNTGRSIVCWLLLRPFHFYLFQDKMLWENESYHFHIINAGETSNKNIYKDEWGPVWKYLLTL